MPKSQWPVGLFFHSRNPDRSIDWQGRVLRVRDDMALVETYSWLDGSSAVKRLVSMADLRDWDFYETVAEMRIAYVRSTGASPREVEDSEQFHQVLERMMRMDRS